MLATSVRDDEDTLESFERRVRENEATVRRVHEREKERFKYEKKNRSEKKLYFRYSEQIKKIYKKENNISTERVQRLLNKLIIKESLDQNKDKTRKSLISANENVVSRKSLRSCRHCDENH
jgi:L-fucose isomerase-like protein